MWEYRSTFIDFSRENDFSEISNNLLMNCHFSEKVFGDSGMCQLASYDPKNK